MADRPAWASHRGLPSEHVVRAAIHVGALLDRPASAIVDARESYWHRATGGTFAPPDLELGERLLVDVGLVIEQDGRLHQMPELQALLDGTFEDVSAAVAMRVLEAAVPRANAQADARESLAELVPDPQRREEMLAALGRRFDDSVRRLYGAIGEELVVVAARAELDELGYPELARAVRHVSLETDQAGYDVSAPRIEGTARLLEVKATAAISDRVCVHLSRNEAETGARYEEWAVVVCTIEDVDARRGEIVGWCTATTLKPALPTDSNSGRWESAELELNVVDLVPGLPSAVA